MPKLQVNVLGEFRAMPEDGTDVPLRGKNARALLAFLVSHADRTVPREQIVTLLWGTRFDDQGRRSLRQCLFSLRRAIDDDGSLIVSEGETLKLNGTAVASDLARFEQLASTHALSDLREAAELYRGEILEGLDLDEEATADWLRSERPRLSARACELLERLAELALEEGQADVASAAAQRLVDVDPIRETGHRTLMTVLADSGRRNEALRQYRTCCEILERELDTTPETQTVELYNRLRERGATGKIERLSAITAPESSTTPQPPDRPSIVVLPFSKFGDDAQPDYLADGMTEDLITALSRLRGFFVISRHTSFMYRGSAGDIPKIGSELGVRYALEGSVRGAGERIRVSAQLIDTESASHVWVDQYDCTLADIFDVQDDITRRITNALGPELIRAEAQRLLRRPPQDMTAWGRINQGFTSYWRWTKDDLAQAQARAREALELDPENAEGWALLSLILWAQATSAFARPGEAYHAEALDAVRHAVGLDPHSARAHIALGVALLVREEHDEAVAEVDQAMDILPGSSEALVWSGLVHAFAGPQDLAIERIRESIRLNPRDPQIYGRYQALATAYFGAGYDEDAVEAANRVIQLLPELFVPYTIKATSLAHLGLIDQAAEAIAMVIAVQPPFSLERAHNWFRYRDAAHKERLVEGLRIAGLV